jgi:DNA-binding CsgD family transcriptional regulator
MDRINVPTAREIQVLDMVIKCRSIAKAARLLGISSHTVDSTGDSLRRKSGFSKIRQISSWAAENGWLPLEPALR